jgi:hypothetical protein
MSIFERLQLDLEQHLLSHTELQYLTVTHVRPRTSAEAAGIQTKINNTLAGLEVRNGRRGVAVIIGMPQFSQAAVNVRALRGQMTIVLEVIENIVVNTTGASCEEHAWEIARLLQHMQFQPWSPLVGDPQLITPSPEAVLDKKVIYSITMTMEVVAERKDKVATPSIAAEGAQITLACATSGAAIYYTLDESFPGPGNADADLYTAPFTLAAGSHVLRVAAHKSGSACSDAVMGEVEVGAE